ncbi:Histidine phosphatase superfamily, clade-2-containing protein [Aphelenchoides bicaudatus]|nr:Histidine phosphatase superfamily, clade-2-containing protein [Aphelenchoides bicaudatus]
MLSILFLIIGLHQLESKELDVVNGVLGADINDIEAGVSVEKADTGTLVHVHAIWRHGERNPWNVLPSDPMNGVDSWPGGLKQFTRRGMEQNYHLGELIRKRYGDFLSAEFQVEEVYIRSSDKDRTLMAAQSTMAGLFPTDRGIRRVDDLNPIPIHTMPYDQDRILNDRVHCPRAEMEEQLVYKSEKFPLLLEFLGEHSGLGQIPLPFSEVWKVWEPLNGELLHPESHKSPEWLTPQLWKQITHAYDRYSYGLFDSPLFRRLRTGPLLAKLIDQMNQKLAQFPEFRQQKLYAISAHDSTIAGFLRAFGVEPEIFPLFATALFIELHKGENGPFIRVFHRNNTATDEIHEVHLSTCSSNPCSFAEFKNLAREVTPSDWPLECELEIIIFALRRKCSICFAVFCAVSGNHCFLLAGDFTTLFGLLVLIDCGWRFQVYFCLNGQGLLLGALCVLFFALFLYTFRMYRRAAEQKRYSTEGPKV